MEAFAKSAGKWGSFLFTDPDGKTFYATPSSKLTTAIELGKYYEVTLFKPEGKKSTYITKAELIETKQSAQEASKKQVGSPAPKAGNKAQSLPTSTDDKMSKAEWAKKDEGIKWLACVKAACVFNATRESSSIHKVLADARCIFNYNYLSKSAPTEDKTEETENVFEENGI